MGAVVHEASSVFAYAVAISAPTRGLAVTIRSQSELSSKTKMSLPSVCWAWLFVRIVALRSGAPHQDS